ncbi:hypothetical protein SUDANB145_07112 [Streptomyces sp. enrichment culture]
MSPWPSQTLKSRLHRRPAGVTPGTLVWVWSVVVGNSIFVRSANPHSRWFAAAMRERAGIVRTADYEGPATFTPVTDEELKNRIDAACTDKYAHARCFSPAVLEKSRQQIDGISPARTGRTDAGTPTTHTDIPQDTDSHRTGTAGDRPAVEPRLVTPADARAPIRDHSHDTHGAPYVTAPSAPASSTSPDDADHDAPTTTAPHHRTATSHKEAGRRRDRRRRRRRCGGPPPSPDAGRSRRTSPGPPAKQLSSPSRASRSPRLAAPRRSSSGGTTTRCGRWVRAAHADPGARRLRPAPVPRMGPAPRREPALHRTRPRAVLALLGVLAVTAAGGTRLPRRSRKQPAATVRPAGPEPARHPVLSPVPASTGLP